MHERLPLYRRRRRIELEGRIIKLYSEPSAWSKKAKTIYVEEKILDLSMGVQALYKEKRQSQESKLIKKVKIIPKHFTNI